MGEVYRVEDTNLSREVAIKVLAEQFTKDSQLLAQLLALFDEAIRALASYISKAYTLGEIR